MTAHEYKAEMAKEILENAGIKVVILNQQDSAYKIGEFSLYVAEKNKTQSLELLKKLKN